MRLRVEEVIEALNELGGEAEWSDIEARVTEKRGGSHAGYQDWDNFNKTMFQLVQRHCKPYKKFEASTVKTVLFEKVRAGRFRLAPSLSSPSPGTPAVTLNGPSLTPQNYQDVLSKASAFQAGGEGEEHRQLKEFVASTPQLLQLPAAFTGATEYRLPSGDKVDVLFQNGDEWIAVEVKPRGSPEADVTRGIFQCIKYQAVIKACQAAQGLPPNARAILVLEALLPQGLIRLKNMLGVEVLDRVKPRR